ncbi:MAG TPA: amidohydrolase family protein, partial [Acidimicrobiia bacterium]|nr:amidohydrolase family protein [Acidimicrobiia bacterium]
MTDVELAIRGGTVIDGTGAPGRRADVGIRDGRVVVVDGDVRGEDEIDATGRLVTPGFIDIHTHYDAQVLWDPTLSPSSWQGVTTVVMGNCGFTLAPVRPEGRDLLLRTLEKVEDMRLATMEAGITWDFASYGEYLDAIERRRPAINVGGYVGHTAVRVHVMGADAAERAATADETARMVAVVRASLREGAL